MEIIELIKLEDILSAKPDSLFRPIFIPKYLPNFHFLAAAIAACCERRCPVVAQARAMFPY